MNVVTNEGLAKRRRRQASLLSLAGLTVLAAGLYFNFSGSTLPAYAALLIGSLASWTGIALADRWVRPPRADRALAEGLKGAGRPYSLYNWVLPPEHVLSAPWGLTIFLVANVDGHVVVRGDRWSEKRPFWRKLMTLGRRPLGNPPRLARLETETLARVLADTPAAGVPIDAAVVLSNPDATADAEDNELSLLTVADLRGWLKSQRADREQLSSARRREIEKVLADMADSLLGG
jgi:hypothetical protein